MYVIFDIYMYVESMGTSVLDVLHVRNVSGIYLYQHNYRERRGGGVWTRYTWRKSFSVNSFPLTLASCLYRRLMVFGPTETHQIVNYIKNIGKYIMIMYTRSNHGSDTRTVCLQRSVEEKWGTCLPCYSLSDLRKITHGYTKVTSYTTLERSLHCMEIRLSILW